MKKKGLVAMGVAGVMTIGMCVPVLAAEDTQTNIVQTGPIDGKPENPSAASSIEITEPIVYTVSIPKEFTTNESELSLEFSTTGIFNIEPKAKVTISTTDTQISLKNQSDETVTWKKVLKDGDNNFNSMEFTNIAHDSKILKLVNDTNEDDNKAAGVYKGNVQFTIAYDDGTSPAS